MYWSMVSVCVLAGCTGWPRCVRVLGGIRCAARKTVLWSSSLVDLVYMLSLNWLCTKMASYHCAHWEMLRVNQKDCSSLLHSITTSVTQLFKLAIAPIGRCVSTPTQESTWKRERVDSNTPSGKIQQQEGIHVSNNPRFWYKTDIYFVNFICILRKSVHLKALWEHTWNWNPFKLKHKSVNVKLKAWILCYKLHLNGIP